MKVFVNIDISPYDLGDDLYKQFESVHSAAKLDRRFTFRVQQEDPRLAQMLSFLQEHGFQPVKPFRGRQSNEFLIDLRRVYDTTDYEQAAYMEPRPAYSMHENYVHVFDPGVLHYEKRADLDSALKAGIMTRFPYLFVTLQVKDWLEQSGLQHVVTRLMQMDGPKPRRYEGQFWELTSDLTLPPVALFLELVDGNGQPFTGDYANGCYFRESLSGLEAFYMPPELHYTAGALADMEPFDLAYTQERFGAKHNGAPSLIASQRFHQCCVQHKLEVNWTPVLIDP